MNALNRKKIESALEFIEEGVKDIRRMLDESDEPQRSTPVAPPRPPIQLNLPEQNGRYTRTPAAPIPAPVPGEPEYISMPEAMAMFKRSTGWFNRRIESGQIKAKLHPAQKADTKRKHWYVCMQDVRIVRAQGEHHPIAKVS